MNKPQHRKLLVSLLANNEPPLTVGEHEWESFFISSTLSASLLIKLLRFKYRDQKHIRVIEHEEVWSNSLNVVNFLNTPLSTTTAKDIEYELVILAHKVNEDNTQWPVLSLLVRRRLPQNNILFTVPVSDISSIFTADNYNNDNLTYVINNKYSLKRSQHHNDNQSHAIFYFLDLIFQNDVHPFKDGKHSNRALYLRGHLFEKTTKTYYTALLVDELTKPHRVCDALALLYKNMNELLTEMYQAKKKKKKVVDRVKTIHERVEQDKGQFYMWVQAVLENVLYEPSEVEDVEIDDIFSFSEIDYLSSINDPMLPSDGPKRSSDLLFEEMLRLLRFVMTLDVTRNNGATVFKEEEEYTLDQVKTHIRHLRYRLLSNVDYLNLRVSEDVSIKTRFNQNDFASFIKNEHPYVSYNMLATLNLNSLLPDILLLGPRDLLRIKQEEEQEEQEARNNRSEDAQADVEKVEMFIIDDDDDDDTVAPKIPTMIDKVDENRKESYREALSKIIADKRVVLWVLTLNESFSALLIVSKPISGVPRFVLHLPTYPPVSEPNKLEETQKFVREEVIKRMWDTKKNISLQLTFAPTNIPSMHSVYVAYIIDALNRPTEDNVYKKALHRSIEEDLVGGNQPDALLMNFILPLKTFVKNTVLQTLLPPHVSVHIPIEDEKEAGVDFDVKSRISDITKLQLDNQYIDDPILQDMIMLLKLKTGCYCFSPLFWTSVRRREMSIKDKLKNRDGKMRHRGNPFFNTPSKDIILIPINQNNVHWSLGVVDIAMSIVRYYSSSEGGKDAYYKTFKTTIESFLKVQLPGVKFAYSHLDGETQGDTVDCALFVLNKISELGVTHEDRRTYTRQSIARSLLALFLRKLIREGWPLLVEDVTVRYFDQVKNMGKSKLGDVPTPGIWGSVADDEEELKKYKAIYLASLLSLLSETLKYDAYVLAELEQALLSADVSKGEDAGESIDKVTAIFEDKLTLKKEEKKKKRVRSARGDDEDEKRAKASKIISLVSRPTLEKVIGDAIEKKKAYDSFGGLFDYKNEYSGVISKNLEPFIRDKKDLHDATNAFINALFVSTENEEKSYQAVSDVLNKYSISEDNNMIVEEEKEGEEDVCKLYLMCFYCNAATNQVDPLTQRVYCSLKCRLSDKINFF